MKKLLTAVLIFCAARGWAWGDFSMSDILKWDLVRRQDVRALVEREIDTVYAYPVFELKLGGRWTDFEIKASTNNFATDDLVYFYMSSSTNAYGADDPAPLTYFVDDYAHDMRRWVSVPPHVSIAALITHPQTEVETVTFMPSRTCQTLADTWMWRSNTNLVWSYARYGAVGYETNATGTKTHWNPVRPQSWEKSRTTIP
jgi:hypothetical protein